MRVVKFKLQIIKITIQNKKNPCLKHTHEKPARQEEGQEVWLPGTQRGPRGGRGGVCPGLLRESAAVSKGQKAGAAQGAGWGAGLQVVSAWGSRAAGSSCSLCFHVLATWTGLALEIYCTVLEEAWGRGRAGAAGKAGRRQRSPLGLGVFSDLPDHQVHAGAGVLAGAVPVHCRAGGGA